MKKIILTSIVALAAGTALMAAVNPAGCKGCHGQNFEKKALGKSAIVANMTHEEIANHHGTSREVVSRMLKKFEKEGLVTLARKEIHLLKL